MEQLIIHAPHPSLRKVNETIKSIEQGNIVVYPTDSLLAVGCDPLQKKSVIRLCQLKGIDPSKANLTYLCAGITDAAILSKQIGKELFRLIKRNTPGPFTFILTAGKDVPHHFSNKKKTIGIRIPQHYFIEVMLREMGRPLLSISLASTDEEQLLYPDELVSIYRNQIDLWIDDERPQGQPSTIIDCTDWPPEIIREGGHALVW
ncbi:MAG: threonylcarbamoyl-AMP synthase [Saprospiraceae bacterium]|nr:threonylcarbamoyl-AMP synthase [Saprospiraceae bacterium]